MKPRVTHIHILTYRHIMTNRHTHRITHKYTYIQIHNQTMQEDRTHIGNQTLSKTAGGLRGTLFA